MKKTITKYLNWSYIFTGLLLLLLQPNVYGESSTPKKVPILLDQEECDLDGNVINASTQSINRYNSVLRDFDQLEVKWEPGQKELSLNLWNEDKQQSVELKTIDIRFLSPLLPYKHQNLDNFDRTNLMLAECMRTSISLAKSEDQSKYGHFTSIDQSLFNDEEYLFEENEIKPNPQVRPNRISVANNCLNPGLWEISASDSVGEMYHGWFEMPKDIYFDIVKEVNQLKEVDAEEIAKALDCNANFNAVLDLQRLRKVEDKLGTYKATLVKNKPIGSYSSQESRRKVQRGFFSIERDNEKIEASELGSLQEGDEFKLMAFVAPGIYTEKYEKIVAPFSDQWEDVEIRRVEPLTRYPESTPSFDSMGHLEVTVYSKDRTQAIIVGNIPVELLVFQEDYRISGFGVGIFPPSELAERRYWRLKEGPAPHYAYLVSIKEDGEKTIINNHNYHIEQAYLRPVKSEDGVALNLTLVSYERIVDLMEVSIDLDKELSQLIEKASEQYKTPLFRSYSDSNVL